MRQRSLDQCNIYIYIYIYIYIHNERNILGLTSHDCHVLMQQLLPLAIRRVLHKNVCTAIVELCSFFKQLCSKVLKTDQLEHL